MSPLDVAFVSSNLQLWLFGLFGLALEIISRLRSGQRLSQVLLKLKASSPITLVFILPWAKARKI